MIYARARNGAIGKDGKLPWHLPEDLAHFRQVTLGFPVIMGRRTWDSLPARFRPLPGRRNIVVSRNTDWRPEGAEVVATLDAALALCALDEQAWVIGGGEMYRSAMPIAARIEVTEIDADFEGDTFMPPLAAPWVGTDHGGGVGASGLPYRFVTYIREPRGD